MMGEWPERWPKALIYLVPYFQNLFFPPIHPKRNRSWEGGRKERREEEKKERTRTLRAYALGNSWRLQFHCNCLLPPNFISMFPKVTMLPDNIYARFCLLKMTGFLHVYIHACGCVFTVPHQVQLSKKDHLTPGQALFSCWLSPWCHLQCLSVSPPDSDLIRQRCDLDADLF